MSHSILIAVAVSYAAILVLHFAVLRCSTKEARKEGEAEGYRKGFQALKTIKKPTAHGRSSLAR